MNVRREFLRQARLHLVGCIPAGVRGAATGEDAECRPGRVLQTRQGEARREGACGTQGPRQCGVEEQPATEIIVMEAA